jgi:hypothetical protein
MKSTLALWLLEEAVLSGSKNARSGLDKGDPVKLRVVAFPARY